jgi:hypothetical protein
LLDVSTDPQDLIDGIGGISAFIDLGTGVNYGTHIATEADEGTFIIIPLNASAVADANAAEGGLWAIGGAITTLDKDPTTDDGIFGASAGSPNSLLVLTVLDPCPWDLDGSGSVGTADLLDLLSQWGTDPGGPPDFDGDMNVGTSDLLELLSNWGPCP